MSTSPTGRCEWQSARTLSILTAPTARSRSTPSQTLYYVTLQYSQNDPESFWPGTYETLLAMQDGESMQSARGLVVRQRAFEQGRFKGIEFITTLPETAQTEPVYIRQVILLSEQGEVLVVMGTPNNVQVGEAGWREAYQRIDEANLPLFRQMVESIAVQ